MHHVTDVAVGMLNGFLCALLAYAWFRRRDRAEREETPTVSTAQQPAPAA
jgi:membrane-associated phospholipid phosphatase